LHCSIGGAMFRADIRSPAAFEAAPCEQMISPC
jgi:hypothetical protein